MKFVADEGVDGQLVAALRTEGYSVDYIAEPDPGISDSDVLERSTASQSLLLTADRDFRELVFRHGHATTGVLLLRLSALPTQSRVALALSAIRNHAPELAGEFAVLTPAGLRIRRSQPH